MSDPKDDDGQQSSKEKKSGIINKGYGYERHIPAYFALKLLLDNTIKFFTLDLNSSPYQKFDDLTITVEKENTVENFAIQLKHREKDPQECEASKEFCDANSKNFNISKYLESFDKQKPDVQKKYNFVLFTNARFINVDRVKMYCIDKPQQPFETDLFNGNENYQFKGKQESLFWDKFYLISAQKNDDEVKKAIIDIFQNEFHSDEKTALAYIDFFKELHDKAYSDTKIDRDAVVLNLMKFLVNDYIPNFDVTDYPDPKTELIERALMKFDITVLNDNYFTPSVLKKFWKSCLENPKNLTKQAQKFKLIKKAAEFIPKYAGFLHQKPLFLEVTAKSEKTILAVTELLTLLGQPKLSLVLLRKSVFHNLHSFESLQDLKQLDEELYQKFIETFKISFQGRPPQNLEPFDHLITPKEIFRLLVGELVIGQKLEELPEVYIPRKLIRSDLTIDGLDAMTRTTMVHCGGYSQDFRKALEEKNFRHEIVFVTDYEPKDNPVLILTDHEKVPKNKKSFQHLKLTKGNVLEWIEKEVDPSSPDIYEGHFSVLSGVSGSGKTTMMKKLAKECPSDYWVVCVSLQQVTSIFNNSEDIVNKLLKPTEEHQDDANFWRHFVNTKKVIFFFDGLNELTQSSVTSALKVFDQLSKDGYKIWVSSTKPNLVEENLKVTNFFTFGDLTLQDQETYIWKQLKIENFTQKFFHESILKIPLLLFILTEVLRKDVNFKRLSLAQLYGRFFEGKIQHHVEKTGCKHYEQLKDIVDGFRDFYVTGYQAAALQTCLEPKIFTQLGVKMDKRFFERMKKGDFLEFLKVDKNNTFTFSHQTFGEYFAAMWLNENFEEVSPKNRTFIFRSEYEGIRRFFDAMLAADHPLHLAVLEEDTDGVVEHKNLYKDKDKGGRTALHLAASLGYKHKIPEASKKSATTLKNILSLLLDFGADPLEKDQLFQWNCFEYADASLSLSSLEEMSKNETLKWEYLKTHQKRLRSLRNISVSMGYTNLLSLVIETYGLPPEECLLHVALEQNQEEVAALLFANGADLTKTDGLLQTPLHKAAMFGLLKSAEFLVNKEVPIDPQDGLGRTPLHLAAKFGHKSIVALLLAKEAKIDLSDFEKKTALHKAAYMGKTEIVELLCEKGTNINSRTIKEKTALHRAAEMGHLETVKCLGRHEAAMDEVDRAKRTPLHYAAIEGYLEVVEYLVDEGVKVLLQDDDGKTPKDLAENRNHEKIVEMLTQKEKKCSLRPVSLSSPELHQAAEEGNLFKVNKLLERGANPAATNDDKRVPLHLACQRGHLEVAQKLLNRGQNDATDKWGFTPLHRAAYKGHLPIVKLLVEAGVDVNCANVTGGTPLMSAARGGHNDIIEYLMSKGGDVNKKSSKESSCLHDAVKKGFTETVEFLVKTNKELVDEVDYDGKPALFYAVRRGFKNMVEILVKEGAKISWRGETAIEVAKKNNKEEVVKFLENYR